MPCKPPSVMARMDKIMNLHKYGEDKERPATNNAHAAASAEASGATKTTVGKATDDGLTSSATTNTQDDEGAIYANRTFHNNVIMRVETEGQHDLKLALNNNSLEKHVWGPEPHRRAACVCRKAVRRANRATPHPHRPLKEQRLKTLVLGVMDARRKGAGKATKNRLAGDLCFMPDGGRCINSKFRNWFVDEDTAGTLAAARQINVHRSEDGLTARRRRARHFVNQMETFHPRPSCACPREKEGVLLRHQPRRQPRGGAAPDGGGGADHGQCDQEGDLQLQNIHPCRGSGGHRFRGRGGR